MQFRSPFSTSPVTHSSLVLAVAATTFLTFQRNLLGVQQKSDVAQIVASGYKGYKVDPHHEKMRIIVASSLIDLEYSGYSLSLMCLRCLEKVPNIFSQMVVNDGDESHVTIRKKITLYLYKSKL